MPAKKSKVAAKRPARRTTAKVSPVKGMSVEAWIAAKTKGWQADVANRLVALVKKAAPKSQVSIKWARPVFEHNGPFAYVATAKAHVTFGFWRGAELEDPAGVLEGGDRMKHVKLTSVAALNERQLAAFVRQAFQLNDAKGNPTLR